MKYFLILFLSVILLSCAEEKPKEEPQEKAEQPKAQYLSEDDILLNNATYLYVKERVFRKEGDISYVKMHTVITNKTDNDIHCIKGWLIVKDDLTGKEFCKFYIDCPKDIAANSKIEYLTDEFKCDDRIKMHRKLLEMEPLEFNSWVTWRVDQIKFSDGKTVKRHDLNEEKDDAENAETETDNTPKENVEE